MGLVREGMLGMSHKRQTRRRPRLDTKPPAEPRGGRAGKDDRRGFYADQFTAEELALVAASATDPALDDEIWLARVLNRRMLAHTRELEAEGGEVPLETLVKAVQALFTGTGRVARLLRDRQVLSGEALDELARTMAEALEGIFDEMGWQP